MTEMNQENQSMTILPRIRVNYSHEIYNTDQGKPFINTPLFAGMDVAEDEKPLALNLFEDIYMNLAIDKGQWFEMLNKGVMKDNPDLTEEVLYNATVGALIQEIGDDIQMEGNPNHILRITAGGEYEAAIILIDDFWEFMHKKLEDNFVMIIPAKDALFVAKESNKEATEKLKEIVQAYFEDPNMKGLLSKGVYLRKAGEKGLKLIDKAF